MALILESLRWLYESVECSLLVNGQVQWDSQAVLGLLLAWTKASGVRCLEKSGLDINGVENPGSNQTGQGNSRIRQFVEIIETHLFGCSVVLHDA